MICVRRQQTNGQVCSIHPRSELKALPSALHIDSHSVASPAENRHSMKHRQLCSSLQSITSSQHALFVQLEHNVSSTDGSQNRSLSVGSMGPVEGSAVVDEVSVVGPELVVEGELVVEFEVVVEIEVEVEVDVEPSFVLVSIPAVSLETPLVTVLPPLLVGPGALPAVLEALVLSSDPESSKYRHPIRERANANTSARGDE